MLEIIGTLLTSILSGGATGLIGVGIQRFFDWRNKQQDIEIVKLNHENARELAKMEIEKTVKIAEGQIGVARETAAGVVGAAEEATKVAAIEERSHAAQVDADMYGKSVDNDRATYLTAAAQEKSKAAAFFMGMVDWVRGMTRPALTVYLVVITHYLVLWVVDVEKRGAALSGAEKKEIILMVVSTVLYMGTTALLWWFGTRPAKQPGAK